jgi:hypothetical protein
MARLFTKVDGLFGAQILTQAATSVPKIEAFAFINGVEWDIILRIAPD